MLKFNSRNIISGYIKQLLYSFNLPICRVFENEEECKGFFTTASTTSSLPIFKDNYIAIIRKYKDNRDYFVTIDSQTTEIKIKPLYIYRYNHFYPNLTKKLRLENDIYDSYTHTYLGNYLRFIRDYFDINLMSLYNCYNNETIIQDNYKYMLIPIKYNTTYTVFTEKNNVKYLITNEVVDTKSTINTTNLSSASKINNSYCLSINIDKAPSMSIDQDSVTQISKFGNLFKEENLKLIIQTNIEDESPIVVLEGDYTNYKPYFTNYQLNYERENWNPKANGSSNGSLATSNTRDKYEYEEEYGEIFKDNIGTYNFQLINQLRRDNNNYPIADRLIEYLLGNVITELDPISKNIVDAKKKLAYRYLGYSQAQIKNTDASFNIMDRFKLLDAVSSNKYSKINDQDLLGYVDKDVESILDDERYPMEVVK